MSDSVSSFEQIWIISDDLQEINERIHDSQSWLPDMNQNHDYQNVRNNDLYLMFQ
jgi:hypothetical protein